MKIIAHDEDSMTNLFFSEVHRLDKLQSFLNQIKLGVKSALDSYWFSSRAKSRLDLTPYPE